MRLPSLAVRAAPAILTSLLLGACSARSPSWPSRALPSSPPGADGQVAALLQRAEEAWSQRSDPSRLREAVARWEEAARSTPTAETYVRLAQARFFLGESVYAYDKTQPALLLETHDKGVRDAEVALALASPEFHRRVRRGGAWDAALDHVGPEGVPALYWYTVNLTRWAQVSGRWQVWLNHGRIRASMARCLQVDPGYFHGAAHRYFGAYYALSPWGAGEDLDRSRNHFREALAKAPAYLGNKVLMAETYCVAKRDRALFRRLLQEAVSHDVSDDQDVAPEQALERRKAQELLERERALF